MQTKTKVNISELKRQTVKKWASVKIRPLVIMERPLPRTMFADSVVPQSLIFVIKLESGVEFNGGLYLRFILTAPLSTIIFKRVYTIFKYF